MTFHCEECGALLEAGYPCDRCKHDPDFRSSDGFAFDGGGECGKRDCDRSPAFAVRDGPRIRSRCGRHALEELEGIGPAKAETLWEEFGDLDELIDDVSVGSYASSPRIAKLDGFSPDSPRNIRESLVDAGLLDEDELATDGGHLLENSLEGHLEAALEAASDPRARYHIRSALQRRALREGEVGWRGTHEAANGGVTE